jgi:ADP-L-glycero-D-manno-heptose 6-epimerase
MYTVVTGAAGFIGANLVKALNERGVRKIIAVDNLSKADKFRNLVDCEIADYLDKNEFIERLAAGDFDGDVDAILHQGACSDTMESDGRYMMENNYRYSLALLDWCLDQEAQFLYASSAATYGGGGVFREERQHEAPLNVYGYSKFLFDQIVRQRLATADCVQFAGRRFPLFQRLWSTRVAQGAHGVGGLSPLSPVPAATAASSSSKAVKATPMASSGATSFTSTTCARVNLHFLDHPEKSGIFNVGTGRAQTFNEWRWPTSMPAARWRAGSAAARRTGQEWPDRVHPFSRRSARQVPELHPGRPGEAAQGGLQGSFAGVEEAVPQYVKWLNGRA